MIQTFIDVIYIYISRNTRCNKRIKSNDNT